MNITIRGDWEVFFGVFWRSTAAWHRGDPCLPTPVAYSPTMKTRLPGIGRGVPAGQMTGRILRALWQASFLAVLLVTSVIGCAPDPIDRLAARLSSDPSVPSGMFRPILLPATAPPEKVVAAVFDQAPFKGRVTRHKILKVRRVRIAYGQPHKAPPERCNYTAVLTDTNLGRKIVLLQSTQVAGGWWHREYDL